MQRLKNISKLSFLLLMMVAGILAFSSTTQATNFKPYEYTFVVDETSAQTFNGIKGIKQLNITFDEAIPVATVPTSNISVEVSTEIKGETAIPVPIDNLVDEAKVSGNTLSIHFKNLDYIDYTDTTKSYKLVIKSSAGLYVGQAEDLEFPFAIHDILPGFDSIFLVQGELGTEQINSIFAENPPRDIYVHIPKYYLNKIETIHRHDGIGGEVKEIDLAIDLAAATLTNIDVLTDTAVSRLKVSFDEQLIRDLEPHPSVNGFTMGYASLQGENVETLSEFVVKGYNEYGRLLDEENFKVNSVNNESLGNSQIKVSNYIKKKASDFGKTYTLYDLMAKPKIFENILTGLAADELYKLGVTYANQLSPVSVNSAEQLKMASENPNITTINLDSDIVLANELIIDQDVSINGNGSTITGNVTLGKGTKDLRINLNNVEIDGTLTIDTGEGNVIATNVKVDRTDADTSPSVIIKSGGINSIHLINFEATNGIFFANTKPVRVVIANSEELNKQDVTLARDQEVILEGAYGTVTSTSDNANLTVRLGTTIEELVINGAKLTLTYPESFKLPEDVDESKLEKKSSGETEPGSGDENNSVISLKFKEQLSNNASDWGTLGTTISAEDLTDENLKIIEIGEVKNAADFGGNVSVRISGINLHITGLQNLEKETVKDLILIADIDGTTYELKIPIKITEL